MAGSHAISVLLDDDLLTFNRVIGVVRRRNSTVVNDPWEMRTISRH